MTDFYPEDADNTEESAMLGTLNHDEEDEPRVGQDPWDVPQPQDIPEWAQFRSVLSPEDSDPLNVLRAIFQSMPGAAESGHTFQPDCPACAKEDADSAEPYFSGEELTLLYKAAEVSREAAETAAQRLALPEGKQADLLDLAMDLSEVMAKLNRLGRMMAIGETKGVFLPPM